MVKQFIKCIGDSNGRQAAAVEIYTIRTKCKERAALMNLVKNSEFYRIGGDDRVPDVRRSPA